MPFLVRVATASARSETLVSWVGSLSSPIIMQVAGFRFQILNLPAEDREFLGYRVHYLRGLSEIKIKNREGYVGNYEKSRVKHFIMLYVDLCGYDTMW